MKLNFCIYFQQGQSPVGCSPRLHRFNVFQFGFVGVVRGLHPTNLFKNQKYYNLSYFSRKLFFHVKIMKSDRSTLCH